jgi:hypothetical protein
MKNLLIIKKKKKRKKKKRKKIDLKTYIFELKKNKKLQPI